MLIKMLNRLGACASADTLARYIQQKSAKHTSRTSLCLNCDNFFIISADNIDFVHSYSRMYRGNNASNSWSGTSIQAVQPLPSLSEQVGNLHTDGYLTPQAVSKRTWLTKVNIYQPLKSKESMLVQEQSCPFLATYN